MKFPVKPGQGLNCIREMVTEFRQLQKDTRAAILDHDIKEFQMRATQMKSMLEMEIDDGGKIHRIIQHLTWEESRSPYNLSDIEKVETAAWIAKYVKASFIIH